MQTAYQDVENWKQNFPLKVKVFASSDQIIQIYSQHYINRNCHLCDADIDNITHLFFQLPCQAARPLCSFIAPKSSIPGGVLLITTAYFHLIFRIKPFNQGDPVLAEPVTTFPVQTFFQLKLLASRDGLQAFLLCLEVHGDSKLVLDCITGDLKSYRQLKRCW